MISSCKNKYALLVIIFTCILLTKSSSECELLADEVNKEILSLHPITCLKKALRNGWQKVINYLVQEKESEYQKEFIHCFQQELKRLEVLEEEIVLGISETEPIIKWGQNKTHIFLTFKLSHRWDSPPCLYTQSEQSRLEEETFSYNNVCLVSHQKINFKVNLDLNKKVLLSIKDSKIYDKSEEKVNAEQEHTDQEKSVENAKNIETNFNEYIFEVKKDGVGQYSTILLKQSPEIWVFLTKEEKIYPIWHEISQRYSEDFNEYEHKVEAYKISQKEKQANPSQSASSIHESEL